MSNMEQFTIYCTSEQTRKALELGAPIQKESSSLDLYNCVLTDEKDFAGLPIWLIPPTAEQMLVWVEKQGIDIEVSKEYSHYVWRIWKGNSIIDQSELEWFNSRKEATLAAIDAALSYLYEQKEKNEIQG